MILFFTLFNVLNCVLCLVKLLCKFGLRIPVSHASYFFFYRWACAFVTKRRSRQGGRCILTSMQQLPLFFFRCGDYLSWRRIRVNFMYLFELICVFTVPQCRKYSYFIATRSFMSSMIPTHYFNVVRRLKRAWFSCRGVIRNKGADLVWFFILMTSWSGIFRTLRDVKLCVEMLDSNLSHVLRKQGF